jgi:hypothetical protein
MPINIKEIFNSDLDPNSNSWWSQDKIDKINYNFNQFTSGGMVGPMGDQGSFGETGFIGIDGIIGDQGPRGSQGYKGPRGNSEWVESGILISGARHIFPDKNEIQEYSPVVLGIGYLNPNNPNSLIAFSYYDPVLNINTINRPNLVKVNNLKLSSDGIYSEHHISKENGVDVYEEGRLFGAGAFAFSREILINPASKFILETPSGAIKKTTITVSTSNIKIENVDLVVDNTFLASKDFFYETNAGENKILQAIDNLGNVQWVDKNSALPGFSYGMIISVPQFVFNSTNFELETTYTQKLVGNPIRFKYGRGKVGSQYEDWYLCNGQKWNTSPGINETDVPNLNILSISIDSNGDQLQISFNEAGSIIGGYSTKTVATYSNLEYDIIEDTEFISNDIASPIIINTGNVIPETPPTGPNISTLFFTTYTNNTPPTSYPTNFAYYTSETTTCSNTSLGGFVPEGPSADGFGLWSSNGGSRGSYVDLQVGDIIFTNSTSGVRFNGNNQWGRLATAADIAIESNSQNYPLIFRINTEGIITGIYNCSTSTLVAEWSEPTQQTDATHDLTKMIYLVKLNRNDLEWEQSDAVAAPTELIYLNGPFTSANAACLTTNAEVSYSWDGIGVNWSTFNSSTTNYHLYIFGTFSYAPSGWYEKDGASRYWNQSTGLFTNFSICVSYNSIDLGYGLGVSDVNGYVNGSINIYSINTTDFTTATDLWNPSTNSSAAPGWYRFDLDQDDWTLNTSSHRRYWDGTQFRGDTISRNWVFKLDMTNTTTIKVANVSSGSIACSTYASLTSHTIFYAYQLEPDSLPSLIYDLGGSEYKRWIFYVYQNWTEATVVGRGPLVNINSQAFPGSTDPASRVTHLIDGGSGSISTSTVAINSIVGGPLLGSGDFC